MDDYIFPCFNSCLQVDNGGPIRIASSPTNPLASMSSTDNLSHILFEKDHHIATLQSSLDQSDQEKMRLSEQVTDYKRLKSISF